MWYVGLDLYAYVQIEPLTEGVINSLSLGEPPILQNRVVHHACASLYPWWLDGETWQEGRREWVW